MIPGIGKFRKPIVDLKKMNDVLVVILGLMGLGVLWFVLFGQKKHNELMKR